MKKIKSVYELEKWREDILLRKNQDQVIISVCGGTGCHAYGCKNVRNTFEKAIKNNGYNKRIKIRFTGCRGFCERGPIVSIQPQGIFYQKVKERDVSMILSETVEKGKILEHLLYEDPITKEKYISEQEIPFYKTQYRIVLANNGLIEPTNIEHSCPN